MRRILWEKWKDPFVAAVEEHRDRGWFDSYEYLERPGMHGVYAGPFLVGPAGIIPLNELNSPSKNFNLWVGHATFDIDRATLDRMKMVPGVEVIKVWTRYRFWLGVGKGFEEQQVKKDVFAASLPPVPPPAPAKDRLANLKHTLAEKHRFWAIIEFPNGKLAVSGAEDREQVEGSIRRAGGDVRRVVTSWGEAE